MFGNAVSCGIIHGMKKNILLASLLATAAFAAEAATDSSVMKLATSHSSMEVSLWGARILSLKIRGDEVLWRPREWRLERGEGWAHGGIPLCWPWFGSSGPDPKVKHGFAHLLKFSLRRKHETQERSELVLGLSADAETRRLWPHEFDLEYRIILTDRLRLELKTVNTGKETFRFTTGFHPYFAIGERDRTVVTGTDGMRFCDSRKTRALDSVWKGDMPLLSSFDHVFVEKGPTAFHAIEDAARGRRIEGAGGGEPGARKAFGRRLAAADLRGTGHPLEGGRAFGFARRFVCPLGGDCACAICTFRVCPRICRVCPRSFRVFFFLMIRRPPRSTRSTRLIMQGLSPYFMQGLSPHFPLYTIYMFYTVKRNKNNH